MSWLLTFLFTIDLFHGSIDISNEGDYYGIQVSSTGKQR